MVSPAQVAYCGKSVEADVPLIIPGYYPEDAWPGMPVECFFGRDMYEDSWFVDAGTSDVTKMRLNKRGLAVRGGYNPPQVSDHLCHDAQRTCRYMKLACGSTMTVIF